MRKLNGFLTTGLLTFAVTSILEHLIGLPEFIYGLGLGIAIVFEIIGIYSINHDISKLKNFKTNLIKK